MLIIALFLVFPLLLEVNNFMFIWIYSHPQLLANVWREKIIKFILVGVLNLLFELLYISHLKSKHFFIIK